MTTTDPTITIAGLEARINSLRFAVQHSNRTAAERMTMFVEASSNADRLTAERDALAAQLAEVRAELVQLGGADLARDAAEDRAARLDADLAKVRAELAACQTRIAGLEQAANERSAEVARLTAQLEEARGALVDIADDLHVSTIGVTSTDVATRCGVAVARLTARVAELEARPVLTAQSLCDALVHARAAGDFLHVPAAVAADVANRIVTGGPVTLPAQDAADAIVAKMQRYGWWCSQGSGDGRCEADMRRALASLGAPPTSPTQDDPMRHHESRDYALQSPANGYWPAGVGAVNGTEAMVMGAMLRSVGPHPISDAALIAMARTAIECVDKLGAPPTSPPAARPVFAGVSEEELALEYARAVDRIPGIRAVLTRLEVSLVAPVDPEAVARDYANNAATGYAPGIDHPPYWFEYTDEQRTKRTAAMRATLTAAGIPVTPERK